MKTEFGHYLQELTREPAAAGTVAFFDLDRTLIAGYSITALALERVRSGVMSPKHIISHAGVFLGWGLRRAGYQELLKGTVQGLIGLEEAEIVELGQQAFERRLAGSIYAEARTLIDAHRAAGHEVVMVTSATRYQADPIARELGVEHLYCTELEIEDGRITGEVSPCYGEGKRDAARDFTGGCTVAMQAAYFYTDSSEDLPLLEAVGRPVVANPKSALSKIAVERGWPQLTFESLNDAGGIAA